MSSLYTIASTLLSTVETALSQTSAGIPADSRVCVVPGTLAWDVCECGLLAVEFNGTSYSQSPPAPDYQRENCRPYLTSQFTVTMLRCVPGTQEQGRPPTCRQLDTASQILFDDTLAMMRGTAVALEQLLTANTILGYAMAGVNPVGPAGNCVGIAQQVNAWIPNSFGPC